MSENDGHMSVDEAENEHSDSSSSNSSDSEEDDEQEKVLIARAEELERELSINKYLYDLHVEIVDLYRKLGDLNSLRQAYNRFHECFPLTPKLWLGWIKDEIKIANTPEEQKRVFELFDKAVEDYLSVELWIEYAQFSIGASDLQTTRAILEKGLTAAGLHVTEGSLLWDTLRELENAHISLYPENSEEWQAQIIRLSDVFKRQLSVPLFGMENTYNEYQEWAKTIPEGLIDTTTVEWSYKKALSLLETYKPLEEKLMSAESNELPDIYREYVKLAHKDPSTVICLYERALVDLCLNPEVWEEYCRFLFNLGGDAVLKASARALRNCPWCEDLWITKLRVLEKQGREEKELLDCFELGLTSISPNPGLELWLAYLEYVHRKGDVDKLDKLFARAAEQLGFENDPSSKINRWQARLLAKRGDMSAARKLWNSIMSHQSNKTSAVLWLEYLNLERQHGEPNQLRGLFKRALSTNTDWPQCIAEEWLMYEREVGTLEDMIKCVEKTKGVLKTFTPAQTQQQSAPPKIPERKERSEDSFQKRKKRSFEEDQGNRFKKGKFDNQKNKLEELTRTPQPRKRLEKDPKTTVFVSNLHVSVDEEKLKEIFPNASIIEIVRDRKGKSRCYGYVQFKKEEETMTALASDRTPIDGRPVFISELKPEKGERKSAFKYATSTENNKLFVKGLPPNKTKEEVHEIFKNFNPKDVRLVIKKSGQHKGIAYVEFDNEETAQKALKATDQLKLDDDHTISVAISAPPPKKPQYTPLSEPIRHARSRLQMPMIPRTLQVKNATQKVDKPDKPGENGTAGATPKSNADFRNMLLKK